MFVNSFITSFKSHISLELESSRVGFILFLIYYF